MASDDSPRDTDRLADDEDLIFAPRRRCCPWIPPCFGSSGGRIGSPMCFQRMRPPVSAADSGEPWWSRGFKKLREWSELVAGPRWKTFLRRFNRTGRRSSGQAGRFRYDALSYSLNFDAGDEDEDNDCDGDDLFRRGFSSRFASVPASSKSSSPSAKSPALT